MNPDWLELQPGLFQTVSRSKNAWNQPAKINALISNNQ
jgi:hypothetical protein